MLILLSPSKTLDFNVARPSSVTKPRYHREANRLAAQLGQLSNSELAELMGISAKLADGVHAYFADWKQTFNAQRARPAGLAYQGDVYTGLEAAEFSRAELKYAQDQLRILSGLYGVLRPLDLIQPYRLEMGRPVVVDDHQNLYDLWRPLVTAALTKDLKALKSSLILNLASAEYFKAVDPARLEAKVVEATFQEEQHGKLRFLTFFGKKARGRMAKYVIEERVEDVEGLKAFAADGYKFRPPLSTERKLVFSRPQRS